MKNPRLLLVPLLVAALAFLAWSFWSPGEDPVDDDPIVDPIVAPDEHAAAADADPEEAAVDKGEVGLREAVGTVAQDDEPESYRRALGGLTGRLVWKESREPISDTKVQVVEAWLHAIGTSFDELLTNPPSREPIMFRAEAKTDKDGYFELPGLHSRALLFLAIGLKTDKAALRMVDRMPGPGETVDLGEVELLERGTVTGTILDDEGEPLAGARVRVVDVPGMVLQIGVHRFDPRGIVVARAGSAATMVTPMPRWIAKHDKNLPFPDVFTGADGKFVAKGARPGTSSLLVSAQGYESLTRPVRVRAEETTETRPLELKRGGTLDVIVERGGDGADKSEPVAGVLVSAGTLMAMAPFGFLPKPQATDATGKIRLSGLPRAKLYIAFRPGEKTPWQVSGPHSAGDTVRLELPALREGELRLVDLRDQPIAEAEFLLGAGDEAAFVPGLERPLPVGEHIVPKDDAPGVWTVKGLPAGRYRITAKAKGYALMAGVLELDDEGGPDKLRLQLADAALLRFEARTRAGDPVAAARVYWSPRGGSPTRRSFAETLNPMPILVGRTDADGMLETEWVELGATKFVCRHPGYALADSGKTAVTRGLPIRFVLEEGGHIEGTVTKKGSQPEELYTVMAEPRWQLSRRFEGMLIPRFTMTMPDGSFRFRHLTPGEWRFSIAPPLGKLYSFNDVRKLRNSFFGGKSQSATVAQAQVARVNLELEPTSGAGSGAIEGTVRVDGAPAKGVVVRTWGGEGRLVSVVDASGNFRLAGLERNSYYVNFEQADPDEPLMSHTLWSNSIKVGEGQVVTMHLDLWLGDTRVQVVDPSGAAVAAVMVRVRGEQSAQGVEAKGTTRFNALTSDEGVAVFKRLPRGQYTVALQGSGRDFGWVLPTTKIDVGPGAPTLHRVEAVKPAVLAGSIRTDTSRLSKEEQDYAKSSAPSYLVLVTEGSENWRYYSGLSKRGEIRTFRFRGLVPGEYVIRGKGAFDWESDPIRVDSDSTEREFVLRPAAESFGKRFKAWKKQLEAKKRAAKPGKAKKG